MGRVFQIGMDEVIQMQRGDDAQRYDAFTDKFVPKKTTDDCYTPAPVYEAVAGWVAAEYGIPREDFVRPFYPGMDFEEAEYPPGCAVVDNPPFSILTQIIRWYCARGIRFFLFAPALTLFAGRGCDVCYFPVGVDITYENGATVPTSFVTNLEKAARIRVEPTLYRLVDEANESNLKAGKAPPLPKYAFPDQIVTAAICQRWCKYGVAWRLPKGEGVQVSTLDAMKEKGKSIFGTGFLLSERAAAERAAATRWPLSDRERAISSRLGQAQEPENQPTEQEGQPWKTSRES